MTTNYSDIDTWNELTLWGTDLGAGGPGPSPGDQPPPLPGDYPLPVVTWTIDGIPVELLNWSATSTHEGGHDQARGDITLADADRVNSLDQGSLLRAWTGEVCRWEGRLSAMPQIDIDVAHLAASGHKVEAEKTTTRKLIQSSDMSLWATTDSEPFLQNNGANVYGAYQKIGVDIAGSLKFKLDRNTELLTPRSNGAIFYSEGVNITAVRWHLAYEDADRYPNNLQLEIRHANGPSGLDGLSTSWPINIANQNASQYDPIGNPQDLLLIQLAVTSQFTPGEPAIYQVRKLRVNGDVTQADSFSSSDIVSNLAGELGWDDSGVVATTENALPFDWQDDSWAAALTYLAETEDCYWRVGANARLEFAPWGTKVWTLYQSSGVTVDLTPQEIFNRVWVWYETPTGVRRRARIDPADIGVVDPLAYTNVFEYELQDRQPDDTQAVRIGKKLLRNYIRARWAGRLEVVIAFDGPKNDPYGVQPGDAVRIADWAPNQALQLRVMETDMTDEGMALGVEQPITLAKILDDVTTTHRRHR